MDNSNMRKFINACHFGGDVVAATSALKLGLNIEKDFNFQNPEIFFNILNTSNKEIVLLTIDYGFEAKDLLEIVRKYKTDRVHLGSLQFFEKILNPIIFKEELEKDLDKKVHETKATKKKI